MKQDMIVKIEKYLDKLQQKPVTIQQDGFLINQFFMEKMKEVYISLNLNQVYQVEIGENKMILFLDNDTRIQLN